MSYVVEMTDQARTDLRSIYEYIAFALHSRINADRQLDCIEREILSLSELPERYKVLDLGFGDLPRSEGAWHGADPPYSLWRAQYSGRTGERQAIIRFTMKRIAKLSQ